MLDWQLFFITLVDMLRWPGIILLISGSIIGMIFGAIPGLSGTTAIVVLIPMTYGMEPSTAMLWLGAAYGAATYGGAIPSILINTPGEAPNAATVIDGFPMSQKGKAGIALGAAATASTLGGVVGLLVTLLLIPLLTKFLMSFSYQEFFMMAFLGLCIIAVLGEGTLIKGLAAGGFGIMLSFIGFDPINSVLRYTFGIEYLWDGIPVVPALFGLLAIGEIMDLIIQEKTIASPQATRSEQAQVWMGVMETFKNIPLVLRSSALGTFIGAIPGVGGTVAGFFAYMQAKKTCKNSETFGQGDVRGVIAPEAANDAKEGGALLPTLAFGIPGSAAMAVFLGALTLHGLDVGQDIFITHLDVVYMLIMAMLGCHMVAAVIGLLVADKVAILTRIRPTLFGPIIFVICLIGSFALRNSMGDAFMTILFGLLGYEMRKFGFSRIALILGLLLGGMAERSFRQVLMSESGIAGFFTRPISLVLFLTILILFISPYVQGYRKRRRKGI
ncbi:MAG: tripartite tricarboxylate transporter permease [Deltaproteobacteria bacterium]|nr:MAG: tripartite tricarboxylate transporter permease [Deltaproteobacteria bacterium]